MKLYQNQSINESTRVLITLSSNSHFDLDLDLSPRKLKLKLDQDMILSIFMKLHHNLSINKGAKMPLNAEIQTDTRYC